MLLQNYGCVDFLGPVSKLFNDPDPSLLVSTLFCRVKYITENTICKECQLLTFFPANYVL